MFNRDLAIVGGRLRAAALPCPADPIALSSVQPSPRPDRRRACPPLSAMTAIAARSEVSVVGVSGSSSSGPAAKLSLGLAGGEIVIVAEPARHRRR